jgi:hypothetical protein
MFSISSIFKMDNTTILVVTFPVLLIPEASVATEIVKEADS